MGSCLSSGQKSRINYNLSVTSSSSNKEVDNCAKSAVKDSQLDLMQLMQPLQSFKQTSCKDIIAPDSQPILLLDSDSEEYFSVGDDETLLSEKTAVNPIDHPESSSSSSSLLCKVKPTEGAAVITLEEAVKEETKQKLLFELFNESCRVKEPYYHMEGVQGRGVVTVNLPADCSVQTKTKRSPAGKQKALAASNFRLPRLPWSL